MLTSIEINESQNLYSALYKLEANMWPSEDLLKVNIIFKFCIRELLLNQNYMHPHKV